MPTRSARQEFDPERQELPQTAGLRQTIQYIRAAAALELPEQTANSEDALLWCDDGEDDGVVSSEYAPFHEWSGSEHVRMLWGRMIHFEHDTRTGWTRFKYHTGPAHNQAGAHLFRLPEADRLAAVMLGDWDLIFTPGGVEGQLDTEGDWRGIPDKARPFTVIKSLPGEPNVKIRALILAMYGNAPDIATGTHFFSHLQFVLGKEDNRHITEDDFPFPDSDSLLAPVDRAVGRMTENSLSALPACTDAAHAQDLFMNEFARSAHGMVQEGLLCFSAGAKIIPVYRWQPEQIEDD